MEKKPEENVLTAAAEGWITNLPDDVRPKVVQEQYPRIVNKMAALWRHPDNFIEYMNTLVVDDRGDREGFPLNVVMELVTIKDHYEMNVHPERTRAYLWDPRIKEPEKKKKKRES